MEQCTQLIVYSCEIAIDFGLGVSYNKYITMHDFQVRHSVACAHGQMEVSACGSGKAPGREGMQDIWR